MHMSTTREGRWTVQETIERGVALPAITGALFARFRLRDDNPSAIGCWPRGDGNSAVVP